MTANELTKNIIKFIELNGNHAENINVISRMVNGRYVKTNMTKGTSDIHSVIKGKAVMIEVKIGKDRQSVYQKSYQKSIEKAGGIYYIAKDFDSFYEWYNKMFAV